MNDTTVAETGSARAAMPVACRLVDGDGHGVIALERENATGRLRLVLRNRTDRAIRLENLGNARTCSLTLEFRKGVLSDRTLKDLRAGRQEPWDRLGVDTEGWNMRLGDSKDPAVGARIELSVTDRIEIAPGAGLEVALRGVTARAEAGPRLTRVRIGTPGISFSDGSGALDGRQTAQMQLLDVTSSAGEEETMRARVPRWPVETTWRRRRASPRRWPNRSFRGLLARSGPAKSLLRARRPKVSVCSTARVSFRTVMQSRQCVKGPCRSPWAGAGSCRSAFRGSSMMTWWWERPVTASSLPWRHG